MLSGHEDMNKNVNLRLIRQESLLPILNNNNILYKLQYGFRPGMSTSGGGGLNAFETIL